MGIGARVEPSFRGNRIACTIMGDNVKFIELHHGRVRSDAHSLTDPDLKAVCNELSVIKTENHRLQRLIHEVQDEFGRRIAAAQAHADVEQLGHEPYGLEPALG